MALMNFSVGKARRYCNAMGLLDKTNPHATRRSVARWAVFGAVSAPLLILLMNRLHGREGYPWIILLLAAIFGAVISALVEWQLDDGLDEDDEKTAD